MTLAPAAVTRAHRSVTPDPIEARLRALEATVAALLIRVDVLEPVSDADFLTAVATSVEGHVFDVDELAAHAQVDPDLRRVLRGLAGRRLGNKLRTLKGRNLNGLILERVCRAEGGCIWAVLHADAGLGAGEGA